MIKGFKIPKVTFRIRTGDEVETDGGCAIGGEWHNATTDSYFKGKRVVIFSLPGAFTPTCSSQQLPGFEKEYANIKGMGIDEIYCVSVNDSFVMNAWADRMHTHKSCKVSRWFWKLYKIYGYANWKKPFRLRKQKLEIHGSGKRRCGRKMVARARHKQ